MKDDRLQEIEAVLKNTCELLPGQPEELRAEIRRRGEMVDRLLAEQPIVNDGDTGVYCFYCREMLGYCEAERCVFERVLQARDWEPVTAMVEGG